MGLTFTCAQPGPAPGEGHCSLLCTKVSACIAAEPVAESKGWRGEGPLCTRRRPRRGGRAPGSPSVAVSKSLTWLGSAFLIYKRKGQRSSLSKVPFHSGIRRCYDGRLFPN